MSYLDNTSRFREFDPLHAPKIRRTNCVFHLCSFLQEGPRREGDSKRDFICLQKFIEIIKTQRISTDPDFRLDLIISINGHIENQEYIDYLKSINGSIINWKVHITVFQRQNVGWQWGSLHDIWLRYKEIDCNWFVSMEADVWLDTDLWFDYLRRQILNTKGKVGFLGQSRAIATWPPDEIPSPRRKNDVSLNMWRDGNNNVIELPTLEHSNHTRGGFYFCKKSFLKEVDDVYGCFTFAMGGTVGLDSIVLGEVGFSHKTTALGYELFCDEDITRVRNKYGD